MKTIIINGSPRAKDCTNIALSVVGREVVETNGIHA